MTEPPPDTRRALAEVRVDWDDARTERTLAALPARRQGRRARRLAASAAFATVLGAAAVAWLGALPQATESTAGVERRMVLHDGSNVELLQPAARLELLGSSESLVSLGLSGGSARFEVARRPQRRFRVQVGAVRVEVLGTRFTLEPRGAQVHVAVHEGRVQVSWAGERRELGAAEQGLFPEALAPTPAPGVMREPLPTGAVAGEPTTAVAGADAQTQPSSTERQRGSSARREQAPGAWREQAARGEFKAAYALLQRPEARVSSEVDELLLAADSARLSGHPAEAVPFLRRVVHEHPSDARAPLASFTLGNVLLNQLGLPREAEAAYAEARRGTHSETLAQDALARQVEAAHRAGDDALAQRLAEHYVKAYPEGRRLQAVRRFGGLR